MRVLYVEDDPRDVDLLKHELARGAPYIELKVASTLSDARSVLAEDIKFDLALVDLRLPDGSGLELLSEIRENSLPLAVVILTGFGEEGAAVAALKAGADDYLLKKDDYLSRLPSSMESALAAFRKKEALRSQQLKVLYVEHNAADIDLVRRHLQRHAPHIQLETVSSAGRALELLPGSPEEQVLYDVILLDYRLPGLNALELLKIIYQERMLDVPVVLVSGHGDEEVASQAMRLGAVDYLVKHPGYLYQLPTVLENAFYRAQLSRERMALQESEARFRRLAENAPDVLYRLRLFPESYIEYISPATEYVTGYAPEDFYTDPGLLGKIVHLEDRPMLERLLREEDFFQEPIVFRIETKNGDMAWIELRSVPVYSNEGYLTVIEGIARDITGRKKAEEALRRIEWMLYSGKAQGAEAIKEKSLPPYGDLTDLNTERLILDSVGENILKEIASEYLTMLETSTAIYEKNGDYALGVFSSGWCRLLDSASRKLCRTDDDRVALESGRWLCHESCWNDASRVAIETGKPQDIVCQGEINIYSIPIWANNEVVGALSLGYGDPPKDPEKLQEIAEKYEVDVNELAEKACAYESRPPFVIEIAKERLHGSAKLIGSLVERKQTEELLQRRLTELEVLYRVSSSLRSAKTLEEMLPILLDETLSVLDTEAGAIYLFDQSSGELQFVLARGWFSSVEGTPSTETSFKPGEGVAGTVLNTGTAYVSREFAGDPLIKYKEDVPSGWGGACIPICIGNDIVGVFFVSVSLPREITQDELKMLHSLAEMAETAVHRLSLHQETVRRLKQLQSLREIDQAISASLDLRYTLNILVGHLISQLGLDAAAVFLFRPQLQVLEFAAGRGFLTSSLNNAIFKPGEGATGRAVLERRTIIISRPEEAVDEKCADLLDSENINACVTVPLIAKGEIKGALGVYHRSYFNPDTEFMNFLETLAGQAAIAIDNARLFEELQLSNLELVSAYDATINGWARALEMRDRETEGHTRRVTETTLELAKDMGVTEDKLVHIRRGAILHDIGKMGVPDHILLKPGKLTEEEWKIMKQHPIFAYEMLSPIDYLRPAIDIPYYHHEKWDGTGYPMGLKGEEIPLAARIFAVVDVYDALTSDRPYRRAWPKEQALQYIYAQSGRHFDSQVVELFLKKYG